MSRPRTNGSTLATLEDILVRLERLEMAAGLMAQILSRANVPPAMKDALARFAASMAAEKQQRDG